MNVLPDSVAKAHKSTNIVSVIFLRHLLKAVPLKVSDVPQIRQTSSIDCFFFE